MWKPHQKVLCLLDLGCKNYLLPYDGHLDFYNLKIFRQVYTIMPKFVHLTMHTRARVMSLSYSQLCVHLVTISLLTWLLNEETATLSVAKHWKDVLYVLIRQNYAWCTVWFIKFSTNKFSSLSNVESRRQKACLWHGLRGHQQKRSEQRF